MTRTMITNTAPASDPEMKAALENITNAVKDAVRAGIEAAFGEDVLQPEQVQNNNGAPQRHTFRPPAAKSRDDDEPGWKKAGFRVPRSN